MRGQDPHLTDDEIASFLSRGDAEPARARVETHILACGACRDLLRLAASEETASPAEPLTRPLPPERSVVPPSAIARRTAEARLQESLDGKWTLERVLGIGGSAFVYAARHRNGRAFAIKVLRPELTFVPEMVERFMREGRVASRIGHPGALAILDDGYDAHGNPYLVMELLEGETLRQRLSRMGPLSWSEVKRHLEAALEVVAAAHRHGIVHRDLKPENLFVTTDGALRILDFGLARLREGVRDPSMTPRGIGMGTRGFMPPEQAYGQWDSVGPSADVWALGATAAVLLTGATPKPDTRLPALLRRALAPKPEDRFPDAGAMLAELRHERKRSRRVALGVPLALVVLGGVTALVVLRTSSRAKAVAARPAPACASVPNEATSTYSSVDVATSACRVLDGSATYDCGEQGGYRFFQTVGATTAVRIGHPGGVVELPLVTSASSLGPKVEWRGTISGVQLLPYAVIYRLIRHNDTLQRDHHTLVVVKLTGETPCIYAVFEASKQSALGNAFAREAADRACTAACPTDLPPLPREDWN